MKRDGATAPPTPAVDMDRRSKWTADVIRCYTMLYDVYEEPVVGGGAEPPAEPPAEPRHYFC